MCIAMCFCLCHCFNIANSVKQLLWIVATCYRITFSCNFDLYRWLAFASLTSIIFVGMGFQKNGKPLSAYSSTSFHEERENSKFCLIMCCASACMYVCIVCDNITVTFCFVLFQTIWSFWLAINYVLIKLAMPEYSGQLRNKVICEH